MESNVLLVLNVIILVLFMVFFLFMIEGNFFENVWFGGECIKF